MKKLIVFLIAMLILVLPAMAQEEETNISGTVTESVEYNSLGELTDSTELAVNFDIDEQTDVELTLTVDDIVSTNPLGSSLEGYIIYITDDEGEIKVGGDIDLFTQDVGVLAQYKGLKLSDKANLDSRAKFVFPADTWYAVSTLSYDIEEDLLLLAEIRYDSDGAENISAEAQIKYAVNEDIDIKFGVEYNDWSDDINDWDDYSIDSNVDRIYAEFVYKF